MSYKSRLEAISALINLVSEAGLSADEIGRLTDHSGEWIKENKEKVKSQDEIIKILCSNRCSKFSEIHDLLREAHDFHILSIADDDISWLRQRSMAWGNILIYLINFTDRNLGQTRKRVSKKFRSPNLYEFLAVIPEIIMDWDERYERVCLLNSVKINNQKYYPYISKFQDNTFLLVFERLEFQATRISDNSKTVKIVVIPKYY